MNTKTILAIVTIAFAVWCENWKMFYRWHTKPDIKAAMDFQDK